MKHLTRQHDAMDCGPACLQMIARHFGKSYTLSTLRERCFITRSGVSLLGISQAAESIGMRARGMCLSFEEMLQQAHFPYIVYWQQKHFVVVYAMKRCRKRQVQIHVADPARGRCVYGKEEFLRYWYSTKESENGQGIALSLEPMPQFYEMEGEEGYRKKWNFFLTYLAPYKLEMSWIAVLLTLLGTMQFIFPFLTQHLVDQGINHRNLGVVHFVLIAQLVLLVSKLSMEYLRSWLMLRVSYRVNLSFIASYLVKLMRLPIRFFDSKNVGDIMRRIQDNYRIQNFITQASIGFLFSLLTFFVFTIILGIYNTKILLLFLLGNAFYGSWVVLSMCFRRKLDNKRFQAETQEQNNLYQLITGMQDIKLSNSEQEKRQEWEHIQEKLYQVKYKNLLLEQGQQIGMLLFSHSTNILISYVAAKAVVVDEMSLGTMMSLIYIVGQLSSPIEHCLDFAQRWQDAQMSIDRLNEIYDQPEEAEQVQQLQRPQRGALQLNRVSFNYDGASPFFVLKDIDLHIPEGKVTAIVGTSGSGKTTLLKLLMGFYPPRSGEIRVNDISMEQVHPSWWRSRVGVVMQDGYIFSDTIAHNITMTQSFDRHRLTQVLEMVCLDEYIQTLPLGIDTQIGQEGNGLSQGQKQRILIARAIYKNPDYILLDEATNSLDAKNERAIMSKLQEFYKGRTVVVVAHRLSTVKNADQIIVLDMGKIIEQGTHNELLAQQGKYFNLVKEQL